MNRKSSFGTVVLMMLLILLPFSLAAMGTQEEPAEEAVEPEEPTETEKPEELEEPEEVAVDPVVEGLEPVRVSQVGYLPAREKLAVVVIEDEAQPFDEFLVRNVRTDEVVYEGELGEPVTDPNSQDVVQHADFSGLEEPGRYRVDVPGLGSSLWFDISEDVYHDALFVTSRSYTLQRSATSFRDPITGLELEGGHHQDAEAEMFFSDEFHEEGDTLDVLGGWYDAGDFGMYIPPSNVTVGQLLLAYEWNPDEFYEGQLAFPAGVEPVMEGAPDMLEEARFNLEWMLKMQRPDGAVYHKNSGLRWPPDATLPEDDTQTRYVFGKSTFGTAGFAGATAMAARLYEDYDQEFADELLHAAELAFDYLEENPEPEFRYDEGQDQGSGPYDKHEDSEERLWAAAELLRTTGDERYDEYIANNDSLDELLDEPSTYISWADALLFGHWAYVNAPAANEERRERARHAILAGAEEVYEQVQADGYNVTLEADEYYWSSAKGAVGRGNLLLKAHALEENVDYVEAALDQIAYIFGRNANSYSYLTGIGDRSPANPHHRISAGTGVEVPGLLVGGPNNQGGDPLLDSFLEEEDPPPAEAYLDLHGSWATNEYAIDYTAPVVFALSYFAFTEEEEIVEPEPEEDIEVGSLEPGIIEAYLDEQELSTFSDGGSDVDYQVEDEVLSMDYRLRSGGWLGLVIAIEKDIYDIEGLRIEYRGEATGHDVRFEIQDAQQVHFQSHFVDDSEDWQTLEVAIDNFEVRGDWQPEGVDPDDDQPFDRALIDNITFSPLTSGQGRLEFRQIEAY